MSLFTTVRDEFVPIFFHSINEIHERLNVVKYRPVKEISVMPHPQLESEAVYECFKMPFDLASPISFFKDQGRDVWVVDYVSFGKDADVHSRVIFAENKPPLIDPVFVVQAHN